MKRNLRIFFSIVLAMAYHKVYAEYIIFKNISGIPTPITDAAEYDTLYNLLMTYQWPMVIGNKHKIPIGELRELTSFDSPAEEIFLRKKLKTVSLDYEIVYIPTILYELFSIRLFDRTKPEPLVKLRKLLANNLELSITSHQIITLVSNLATPKQELYDLYLTRNSLDLVKQAHQTVNNEMLNFLIQNKLNLDDPSHFFANNAVFLIGDAARNFSDRRELSMNITNLFFNPAKLKTFVDFEVHMHQNNHGFLYRGGRSRTIYAIGKRESVKPIELYFMASRDLPQPTFYRLKQLYESSAKSPFKIQFTYEKELIQGSSVEGLPVDPSIIPLASVSYGNSLMGGYYNDAGKMGACAADYMYNPERLGYALRIEKISSLLKSDKPLFHYSLFNTIFSLFARGEFFHSRTISYVSPTFYNYALHHLKGIPVEGLNIENPFFDKAGFFIRTGDPLQIAYRLSDYIERFASIVKISDEEIQDLFMRALNAGDEDTAYNPQKALANKYTRAQHAVTEMLKAMLLIKKYIPRWQKMRQVIPLETRREQLKMAGEPTYKNEPIEPTSESQFEFSPISVSPEWATMLREAAESEK